MSNAPEHRRVRWSATSRRLAALVCFSVALLVVEVVLRNAPAGAETEWPWHLRLVGVDAAMNLFVYGLLIAVGQRQFADLNRARLTIESDWSARNTADGTIDVREVTLQNTGRGIATILGISFEAGGRTAVSLEELKTILGELAGLHDRRDYEITNFSPGATIASGGAHVIAWCSEAGVAKFETLSFEVRYETAGDTYVKRASLLPYPGAADLAP